MERFRQSILELLLQLVENDTQIILLISLLIVGVIVIDAVSMAARKKRKQAGLDLDVKTVSVDGSQMHPAKNYVSEIQGLAGRPDALIKENGFFIPVENKPLAKKIRDRYVAQLLVYMRLVEEFEGKKPPYGYLILGKNCRRVKILNTDKRQKWLQGTIDEMKAILNGEPAVADPHPMKCKKCIVRESCSFKISSQENCKTDNPKPQALPLKL